MKPRNLRIFRWLRPDYLVVTFLLFSTVAGLGLISFNLSFFNPIKKALSDFSFSDLLYSKLASKQELLDTNIVLVNIGHLNREEIARQIERVRSQNPKVIGFDGFFSARRDSAIDAALQMQFEGGKVVMACYLTGRQAVDGVFDSLETSNPYFSGGARALVNLGGANPATSTVRSFSPVEVFKGDTLWAMSAELVRRYDPKAFARLQKRDNGREVINYTGNRATFICYDAQEILDTNTDLGMIKGKIVLMGYMNDSFDDATDLEDIYYTPMNPELAGRSRPDMYGVVIHANAASMILSGNYINVMPNWLCIVLSYIFCYFYVLFITWFQSHRPNLFKLLFPLMLLCINILIIYLFFILYKLCNYSIHSTWFLVPILLYDTFLTWYKRAVELIDRRFHVPSLFLPPK